MLGLDQLWHQFFLFSMQDFPSSVFGWRCSESVGRSWWGLTFPYAQRKKSQSMPSRLMLHSGFAYVLGCTDSCFWAFAKGSSSQYLYIWPRRWLFQVCSAVWLHLTVLPRWGSTWIWILIPLCLSTSTSCTLCWYGHLSHTLNRTAPFCCFWLDRTLCRAYCRYLKCCPLGSFFLSQTHLDNLSGQSVWTVCAEKLLWVWIVCLDNLDSDLDWLCQYIKREWERRCIISPQQNSVLSTLRGMITRCHSLPPMQVITQCLSMPEQNLFLFFCYQVPVSFTLIWFCIFTCQKLPAIAQSVQKVRCKQVEIMHIEQFVTPCSGSGRRSCSANWIRQKCKAWGKNSFGLGSNFLNFSSNYCPAKLISWPDMCRMYVYLIILISRAWDDLLSHQKVHPKPLLSFFMISFEYEYFEYESRLDPSLLDSRVFRVWVSSVRVRV